MNRNILRLFALSTMLALLLPAGSAIARSEPSTPTPIMDLTATAVEHGVLLTWNHLGEGISRYDVHRSELPYFIPDAASFVSSVYPEGAPTLQFPDDELVGTTNYFYVVTPVTTEGVEQPASNQVAIFNFTLVPPARDGMVYVPGGAFQLGCDPAHNGGYACYDDELPLHTVTLDAYRIDRTEVTNAQYAQCVAAGGCTAPASVASYTRASYYDNPTYANYPEIHVSWYQADAYCRWAGKRLPTEAEWEKAARGASDTRAFPWGDATPTCSLANFYDYYGYCVGDTSAVGSYPAGASPYGALDMAGNVWEWVNDWYSSTYYSSSPSTNPPGPASGSDRVLRGGNWSDFDSHLRVADRIGGYYPTNQGYDIGFRCVAAPGG